MRGLRSCKRSLVTGVYSAFFNLEGKLNPFNSIGYLSHHLESIQGITSCYFLSSLAEPFLRYRPFFKFSGGELPAPLWLLLASF